MAVPTTQDSVTNTREKELRWQLLFLFSLLLVSDKAEYNAKWEAFWEDLAKEYGISQANLLRNSEQIVVKGLDIRVLIYFTAFMHEERKTNVGSVKFYRQDTDGYGVFILYRPTGEEIWIRTQNNKIYDWTLYGND